MKVERKEGFTDGDDSTAYWRLWSDHIIHQIHMRVLKHIKEATEEDLVHARAAAVPAAKTF